MKGWWQRLFPAKGTRSAARRVAEDPTPENYLVLIQESVRAGNHSRVEALCREALELFPAHTVLEATLARAVRSRLDERTRQLEAELALAPRPALWRGLVEAHLDAGRPARAERVAAAWRAAGGLGDAVALQALAAAGVFFSGGLRCDGERAWKLARQAGQLLPHDKEPLRLQMQLAERVGAHGALRQALARLLELEPGNQALEAAWREASARAASAPSFTDALHLATRSGALEADATSLGGGASEEEGQNLRPLLQALVTEGGASFATFIQGNTALVQGQSGATADRLARSVREVGRASRDAARCLGLGALRAVSLSTPEESLLLCADGGRLAAVHLRDGRSEHLREELTALVGRRSNT